MSRGGRLPVAPRPFRDELLSSWLGRVACRYGLDARELVAWWAAGDHDAPPQPVDDFAPREDQIGLWARSCGIDPVRVRRLSLSRRHPERPLSYFSDLQWQPVPVCFSCFDADRAAGRDSYLRADWLLAERCACPAHRRMLDDRCPACGRRLHVSHRMREGHARAVCGKCETLLTGRGGEGGHYPDAGFTRAVLGLQKRIAEITLKANGQRDRLQHAIAGLWAPLDRPLAARPVLALWFDQAGWRCPSVVQHAIGTQAPLGLLPVGWRATTLIAMRSLFGSGLHIDDALPPSASQLLRRAARSGARRFKPSGMFRRDGSTQRRSATDYVRLAREILVHPDWVAAEGLSGRRRGNKRARLVDKVLAQNSASDIGSGVSPQIERKGSPPIKREFARRESQF